MNYELKGLRLFLPLLSSLFSIGVLMGMLYEYDQESAQMTAFYTNSLFIEQKMTGVMGVFHYASAGLMASFARPWLGTLLTTLLIALSGLSLQGTLRMSAAWSPLAYIPGLLCLIPYVGEGYDLYLCKTHGNELAPLLLLTTVGLLLWLLRSLISRFTHLPAWRGGGKWTFLLCLALLLGAGYFTYTRVCQDKTLTHILKMKHHAEQNDWTAVLDDARNYPEEPTRLQVMLTRLALGKLGRSGDDTYSYRDGDAPYKTQTPALYQQLIAGALIYYNYGRLQFAYRWAMENMIEYGMRPAYLETMLKVATLTGEKDLARKYARQLQHSPFYGKTAERWLAYLDNPKLMEQDEEIQSILPLIDDKDLLDGDRGHIEAYLLQSFATMRGGTSQQEQVALDCALVQKSIPDFWPHFANLALQWQREGKDIPRHYQEAALLFSQLQGNVSLDGLAIDPQTAERFNRLVETSNQNSGMSDEYNAQVLRADYGDTYWYYFFFTKGLKTN